MREWGRMPSSSADICTQLLGLGWSAEALARSPEVVAEVCRRNGLDQPLCVPKKAVELPPPSEQQAIVAQFRAELASGSASAIQVFESVKGDVRLAAWLKKCRGSSGL